MNKIFSLLSILMLYISTVTAQGIRIPQSSNLVSSVGRRVGATQIDVKWSAPGVKGRQGKIWGTDIAYFGTQVLGFGSNVESPWRAGADECTTMQFSTDVLINGKPLPAGSYGFFIELGVDNSTLIFNKNTTSWGSYFYRKDMDVLRVPAKQIKDQKELVERLEYKFIDQKDNSAVLALDWEYWRIPITIVVDLQKTVLADIRKQMDGVLGFDPPSLTAAAQWCDQNNVNLEEALNWINSATSANLGGSQTFNALSTKSGLLSKLGKTADAKTIMNTAVEVGSATELHQYGRQLLNQKKIDEAMVIFQKNFDRNKGAWPTHVGMMRGLSAKGDYKKALEHAKLGLAQATDSVNKNSLEDAIKKLSEGKAL